MNQQHLDNQLIRGAFVKMLFVNMFVMFTGNISRFIDNLVIGSRLSTQALSAVGFFSPVAMGIGLFSMIVIGAQVFCGNLIGAGKKDQITSLFNTSFVFLGVLYTLAAILGVLLRDRLAALLGAEGEVHALLCDYILGYIPAIPLQALCSLLTAFVSFNNDIRRSYIAATVISAGNLVGDLLLAGYGTFYIGLTTTLAYVAGFAILLPGYLNKDKTIHLARVSPDWKLLGKAAYRGLPALMLTFGLVVKNSLMNQALLSAAGNEGIAVVNVMASGCDIVGILTGGCTAAYTALAGLYCGEADHDSFCSLFRTALRVGLAGAVLLMAGAMAASPLLAGLFFKSDPMALPLGRQMFLWGYTFLPLNILMNLLLCTYQAQGRMKLVTFLSVAETSLIGVATLIGVSAFGANAAWLTNTAVDTLCLIIIIISVILWRGRIDFSLESFLKLPDDFGAAGDELREYTVHSLDDVCEASSAVIRFCEERGFDRQTSSFGGLCIEEMARNTFELESARQKNIHMDIRVVAREELMIRIRDNCPAFDPRKRLDMFSAEDPCRNIGIRLTARIARDINYYNTAGINTLIMILPHEYQKPLKETLA